MPSTNGLHKELLQISKEKEEKKKIHVRSVDSTKYLKKSFFRIKNDAKLRLVNLIYKSSTKQSSNKHFNTSFKFQRRKRSINILTIIKQRPKSMLEKSVKNLTWNRVQYMFVHAHFKESTQHKPNMNLPLAKEVICSM